MPACGSPRLIAACHVLLRLLLPRHPPCALSSLTIKFTRSTQNRSQLSAISFQLGTIPNTTHKFYGPKNDCSSRAKAPIRFPHPSSYFFSLGTHKNLQPCRLPNLFSCQISSSLEPPLVVRPWPLAKTELHDLPAARLSGYGCSASSC
jgi:hypothetical protein